MLFSTSTRLVNRLSKFTVLVTTCILSACGGFDREEEAFSCLGHTLNFTPRSQALITSTDGAPAEQLCQAEVLEVDEDGVQFIHNLTVNSQGECWSTSRVDRFSYTLDALSVHLNGYKVVQITNLNQYAGECGIISTSVTLEPSPLACAEGYADDDGICKTSRGCTYPQMEEHYPRDIPPTNTYDSRCVDECTLGPSELAGRCQFLSRDDL